MSKGYSQYHLEKNRFRELYYFALQYGDLKDQVKALTPLSAVNLDGMPRGTTTGDPTGERALKLEKLHEKIQIIEECAAATDYPKAVLKGVTTQDVTYNWLRFHGYAYCGKNEYYRERRKFYFLLDKRI